MDRSPIFPSPFTYPFTSLFLFISLTVTVLVIVMLVQSPDEQKTIVNEIVLFSAVIILAVFFIACFYAVFIARHHMRFAVALIIESSQWVRTPFSNRLHYNFRIFHQYFVFLFDLHSVVTSMWSTIIIMGILVLLQIAAFLYTGLILACLWVLRSMDTSYWVDWLLKSLQVITIHSNQNQKFHLKVVANISLSK